MGIDSTSAGSTRAAPAGPREGLVGAFDLEALEVDLFRGRCRRPSLPRAFGGETAGQALRAAGLTVPADRRAHSLHLYFLRPGDPAEPIVYRVDRVRDGSSFSTRRVTAVQRGTVILDFAASFHRLEDGPRHQLAQVRPPAPEQLPPAIEVMTQAGPRLRDWFTQLSVRIPLELRFHGEPAQVSTSRGVRTSPRQRFWLRVTEPLPDDPLLQSCTLTYASDLFLLSTALAPHGINQGMPALQSASLDHGVWFHAPFRVDEWLYYEQESHWAGGARALCQGRFYDRCGTLVASVVQEGLIRVRAGERPDVNRAR